MKKAELKEAPQEELKKEPKIPEKPNNSFLLGLAIGVGIITIAGLAVAVYILYKKIDGVNTTNKQIAGSSVQLQEIEERPRLRAKQTNPFDESREVAVRVPVVTKKFLEDGDDVVEPSFRTNKSFVRTSRLPVITDTRLTAARIVGSTNVTYDTVIRCIGPAGSWAVLAFTPEELNLPGTAIIPVGDSIIIPAGEWQPLPLPARTTLYGKGSVPNVILSITMTARD